MANRLVSDNTVHVYQSVIDDVIAKVKPEFAQEGVDESVLDELRALWEAKLVQTGVLGDANQTEAAQVLGSAAQAPRPGGMQFRPHMAPHMAHHPQFQQYQQHIQPGMAQLVQQQQRYVVPPQAMPAAAAAYAAATAAGQAGLLGDDRKRKLDEAGAALGGPPLKREQLAVAQTGVVGQAMLPPGVLPRPGIPQQDGPADEGDGGGEEEEGGPDEELNENDDLAAVDDEEVDEEQLKDVVLGQFDKVSRTKARWKVQLKDCIITANGRDYLVHKANGEMNF